MNKYLLKLYRYIALGTAIITILLTGISVGMALNEIIYPKIKWLLTTLIVLFMPTTAIIILNQYDHYIKNPVKLITYNIISIGGFYVIFFLYKSLEIAMAVVFLSAAIAISEKKV